MTSQSFVAPAPRFVGRTESRGADALLLASALAHLLDRDEERPGRWLDSAFVDAVALERSRLATVVSARDLAFGPIDGRGSFGDAVQHLGRDPRAIAIAVRRLELARSTLLPTWPDLVRHGLRTATTSLDVSLWFG